MFYKDDRRGHIRDYNFKEARMLLKMIGFQIISELSDGLSISGKTIIPRGFLPKTFGDSVIIKAQVVK
jgi:hypothetical protein